MMRSLTVRGALAMLVAMTVLLGACSADSTSSDAAPAESTPTQTPEPSQAGHTYSPEAGEVQALPQGRKSATMRSGRYAVRLTPTLGYQVDVPDLWTMMSGRFLNAGPKSEGLFFVAPAPSSTGLAQHPCRDHTTKIVGPTVSDLAGALRRQPVLDVTKPIPGALAGYRGLYLEVTIPAEVDAGSCADGYVSLFESGGPDGYVGYGGYVGRWWILEVDGERIVVMPECTVCTDDDLDILTTMAESVTFTRGD